MARQVLALAGPWLDRLATGAPGRAQISAAAVGAEAARLREERQKLSAQVERYQDALHSGRHRLTTTGGHTPLDQRDRLRRALRAAAFQLRAQQDALARCEQELAAAEQVAVVYSRLLSLARRVLAAAGPAPEPPSVEPTLQETSQGLEQSERAAQGLRRLTALWEQIQGRLTLNRREGVALLAQAEQVNQEIISLEQACQGQPSPTRQACLSAALDELAPRARGLFEKLNQLAAALVQGLDQARRCQRSWEKAAERQRQTLDRAGQQLERARQVMQTARQQAKRLQGAAAAVSQALNGLGSAELDPEVAAVALQAWELELPCLRYEMELASLSDRLEAAQALPPPPTPQPSAQDQRLLAGDWLHLDRLQRSHETVQQVLHRTLDTMMAAKRSRQEQELKERLTEMDQENKRLSGVLERSLERQRQLRQQQQDSQQRLTQVLAQHNRQQAVDEQLNTELALARREVERWQGLARSLSISLALAGRAAGKDNQGLSKQMDGLQDQVAHLQKQLQGLSSLVNLTDRAPEQSRPAALRLINASQEQVEQAIGRLAAAGRQMQKLGRSRLTQWLLIIGLTSGLVFLPQSHSPEATPRDLRVQNYTVGQRAPLPPRLPVSLSLDPLAQDQPGASTLLLDPAWRRLARQAGLSPEELNRTAGRGYSLAGSLPAHRAQELSSLTESLALRHPLILKDLVEGGLPGELVALLTLGPPTEHGQSLFLDRLYGEYRRLGYSSQRALKAVITNELASAAMRESWRLPQNYRGRVQPLPAVEQMNLAQFLERITPFVAERCESFLRYLGRRVPANLQQYARDLAFDMYCAAQKFKVPVSFLLAIAHQETFYANVLGDQNRSASPFQIFAPTLPLIVRSMQGAGFAAPPRRIRLQHYLTMATYLAAFHLRELMQESYLGPTTRRRAAVDMDRVMRRYNGSSAYAARVAFRRAELARYLGGG
ncbi:MAG: hypothetical protein C4525_13925 [Desulfarculus sp.]|nr:MAG: hypothetical protein C4525_13925 [Desulfarculus sp.]